MVMNSAVPMPGTGAFGTVCLAGSRHSEMLYIVIDRIFRLCSHLAKDMDGFGLKGVDCLISYYRARACGFIFIMPIPWRYRSASTIRVPRRS